MSRQPVREALRRLQADGLVEMIPRRGARVRVPSKDEIREIFLIRAELEGLAAALASRNITDDGLARLRESHEDFARIVLDTDQASPMGESRLFERTRANDVFHRLILDCAGTSVLNRSLAHLHRIMPQSISGYARHTELMFKESVRQHGEIVAAIAAGDETAAREAARQHVSSSGALIIRWIDSNRQAPTA